MRRLMARASAWLPYLLLGPISGPLAVGLMRSARSRRWMMTAVYAVAIVEAWALLAAAEAYFGAQLLNA